MLPTLDVALALVSLFATQQEEEPSPEAIVAAALATPPRRCNVGPRDPKRDKLHTLLSGGRPLLPSLVERLSDPAVERSDDKDRFLIVRTISYLALPTDDDVIDSLLAFEYDEGFLFLEGTALLRIGGRGARQTLDALATSDLSPSQLSSILGVLWTLRDVEDLESALASLRRVLERPLPLFVRVQVEESGIPRIETALRARRRPHAPETREEFFRILRHEHEAFASLAGGLAQSWALDRLVSTGAVEALQDLERFLAASPLARNNEIHLRNVVRAVLALGGTVPPDDERHALPPDVSFGRLCVSWSLDVSASDYLEGVAAANVGLDELR